MLNVRPREQGFSLVELIIAVTMLAIVLGTVAMASITSSNESIKGQSQVKLAAALENAVERVHLVQPWVSGRVAACNSLQWTGSCTYRFNVTSTERFDFRADVSVTRLPGASNSTFDVAVAVTAFESGTNVPFAQMRPVRTSFVKDLRRLETGDIIIGSCRVNQADERIAAGTCPRNTTWTAMEPPHGMPAPNPPNKSGNSWLIPPYQGYGKSSDRVAWEDIRADGRDRVWFTGNRFRAVVRDANGNVVQATVAANGQHRFTGLGRGQYTVEVSETDGVGSRYDFWGGKSTGNQLSPTRYRVVVTPGTQVRITRLWEPEPVTITMRIKTGDAAIQWEPRWGQNSVRNPEGFHNRATLIPFPEGRVGIPGASAAEYAACPNNASKNRLVSVCDASWGRLPNGATYTTMRNVRPDIYMAYWYQSYKRDGEWHFKKRNIAKSDLGFGAATRWNSTFWMHGRVGYVYVNRNGSISTGNTSTATSATADSNVALRYPGCSDRRGLLVDLFREVPDSSLDDGSKRWVYHQPATGRVYPESLWNSLSPGLKSRLLAANGNQALGWIRRIERRNDPTGLPYTVYVAANGTWDDARQKQQWQVNRFDHWEWTDWRSYPGNGHNTYRDAGRLIYYRHLRTDGTWTYWQSTFPQGRYDAGRPVQWKARYPVRDGWSEWTDYRPAYRHSEDLYRDRWVYITSGGGYRSPLVANILYRNLIGETTRFKVYDTCSSVDRELDMDLEQLT